MPDAPSTTLHSSPILPSKSSARAAAAADTVPRSAQKPAPGDASASERDSAVDEERRQRLRQVCLRLYAPHRGMGMGMGTGIIRSLVSHALRSAGCDQAAHDMLSRLCTHIKAANSQM